MKLGVLSDTHGYMDERIIAHLKGCDLIVHAGDVGHPDVLESIRNIAPVIGVYGNIDGGAIRSQLPEWQFQTVEKMGFLVIHIAGAFQKYNAKTRALIAEFKPEVLVCGHSHILKVAHDKSHDLLYVNPGACGRHGFHKTRTLLTLEVDGSKLHNMRVVELGPRSANAVG
ncbi:MAG: metallophosphoesterase family protein [Salibacteraceae bacterium]